MKLLLVYYGTIGADGHFPLFRELAKRISFIYVYEPPPFRLMVRRPRRGPLVKREDGFFPLEPMSILPFGRWPGVLRFNYLHGGLRRELERFSGYTRVVIACRPKMYVLKGMASESLFVYACRDDYEYFNLQRTEQDRTRAEEAKMLATADAAFCTADTLVEKCRAINAHAYKISNGVDFNLFNNPGDREPEDIRDIPHPRIGTIGKFNHRIDVELIGAVADARPDWSVVLVGPVFSQDAAFDRAFERLVREHPNIHHLGGKPYEELPDYLAALDVAIVPYVLGDLTRGINPLKIFQYFAQGKPVVVTPVPEIAKLTDIAYVAKGADDFVAAVEKALAENDPEHARKRIEYARANTWSSRADQVVEIFGKLLGGGFGP